VQNYNRILTTTTGLRARPIRMGDVMSHITKRLMMLIGALFAASMLYAAPASAQATRTWISGVGDDVNPCSRTAPCKTFPGAISKTAAGGEINCLDPGGFGAVTIVKSITLDCGETLAGILVAGTNGVTVNTTTDPNSRVVLRGLIIDGGPPGSNSLSAVRVVEAGVVTIENSRLFNFSGSPGRGITVDTTAANTQLFVVNTTIDNNSGGGIVVSPGAGVTASVTLKNVRLLNNGTSAFALTTAAGSGALTATIIDSQISGGGVSGTSGVIAKAPTSTATILIKSSSIDGNPLYAINSNGAGAAVRVGDTAITGNGTALNSANSGKIESFGDNDVAGNANPGAFTATIPHS
jgi:hypothetical protein